MLIDYEFGLSQLSGNQALLIKLYTRLHDDYKHADEQLAQLLEEGNGSTAITLIHTLKGVAGNLGCTDLHQSSSQLEDELKSGTPQQDTLTQFAESLHTTVEQLSLCITSGCVPPKTTDSTASSSSPEQSENLKNLVESLNNNEFVTPSQLSECLAELTLSADQKKTLEHAINTLDYQRALGILGS